MSVLIIITALATTITALATLGPLCVAKSQVSLARQTMAADLMIRLEDRFESAEFLQKRSNAAKAIRVMTRTNGRDIDDVLDFFETLGLLVKKGALDKEFAWSAFFYWLHGYCHFAGNFIAQRQKDFPNSYADLVNLHKQLLILEREKKGNIETAETEWYDFLDEEERRFNRTPHSV